MEATKFTEVGFHGRDVDTIIRDLVDVALALTKAKQRTRSAAAVAAAVESKLLDLLVGEDGAPATRDTFRDMYRAGQLDDRTVEVDGAVTLKHT